MEIDKIKWMVGYAEGFEWNNGLLGYYGARLGLDKYICSVDVDAVKDGLKEWVMWPHFLTRAIEGINRKHDPEILCDPRIYQEPDFIKVYLIPHGTQIEKTEYFQITDNTNQAKESALDYIFEQEKKQ